MRILQVSNYYYPFVEMGGPAVKVRAIAENLVVKGHQVTVLTVDHDGRVSSPEREIGGVRVIYLRSVLRYRRLTINPGLVPVCLKQLREFGIVHVYGLYDLLGPTVGFFCRRWGIPYVVEPLGMFRPTTRGLLGKRLYLWGMGKALVQKATQVIATSEQERTWLLEDGLPTDRVVLRRNGIDLAEFDNLPRRGHFRRVWGIAADGRVVLFLGRLVAIKSLDLLIEAFAGLPPGKSWLVITGPDEGDEYRRLLEEMVRRLHIGDRVIFTGPLYGKDKLEALADADFLVLPSQSESFGNAAAEAMACGIPVIVTEGCGISSYVRDRAGLVVRHDVNAIREALRRLAADSTLYHRFKSQAPEVAQELSWDAPIRQMETMYASLASRS